MTDLEMTALCAEAVGMDTLEVEQRVLPFDPLHNDAQAMALMKKFRGDSRMNEALEMWCNYFGPDLNRAIVECVANMQKRAQDSPV